MLLFDCLDVCYFSKVQLMNLMADIKRLNDLFHVETSKYSLVCMATDMEIARYLFNSE